MYWDKKIQRFVCGDINEDKDNANNIKSKNEHILGKYALNEPIR